MFLPTVNYIMFLIKAHVFDEAVAFSGFYVLTCCVKFSFLILFKCPSLHLLSRITVTS